MEDKALKENKWGKIGKKRQRERETRKEGEERRSIELYYFAGHVKALKTVSFIRKNVKP